MNYFPITYFDAWLWWTQFIPSVTFEVKLKYNASIYGFPLRLVGTANDSFAGDISNSIVWTSSLDGLLGIGRDVRANSLSIGTHMIYATVSDSAGTSHQDSWETKVKRYTDFSFDNKLDLWLDTRMTTLPSSYKNGLRGLSAENKMSELRKRGCFSLV